VKVGWIGGELVVMIQRNSKVCDCAKVCMCADWIKVLGLEVRIHFSNCEGYDVLDSGHVIEVGCIDIPQPSDEN